MYQKSTMIDENSNEKLSLAYVDYIIVSLNCKYLPAEMLLNI